MLNRVLDAVYQAKQAAWAASTSPAKADLQDLVAFLIEQSGRFMVAEEGIDGRSASVSSPSSHQRDNLLSEAKGDLAGAVSLLGKRLEGLLEDVRARASQMPDAPEVSMLVNLAEGLEARLEHLRQIGSWS